MNSHKSSTKSSKSVRQYEQPHQVSYRFVNLAVYLLAAIVNSFPVHTFSSINSAVENAFNLDSAVVTLNALLFTIMHPLCAVPSNWILERFGMRIGFTIGGVLVIGGVWLRVLLGYGPEWCLIGSGLAAAGNMFVMNSSSKMPSAWFRVEKIPIIVFLAVLANLVSLTFGASIPGLLLGEKSSQDDIVMFLLVEACVVTVPYILLIIFFRDKPRVPPSHAQAIAAAVKRKDYKDQLKQLFKNKDYIKLMVGMALNYGTLTALIATLDQLLKGLGYTKPGAITAQTIMAAMLIGILGNPVFAVFLKKTKAYKAVALFTCFGGFVTLILLQFLFYQNVSQLIYIIIYAGFAGFFLIPIPAIFIAYASQVTFPMDEGSSTGYLFAASQIFGFCLGMIITLMLDGQKNTTYIAFSIYAMFLLVSFFCVLSTKESLLRQQADLVEDKGKLSKDNLSDSLIIKDPFLGQ